MTQIQSIGKSSGARGRNDAIASIQQLGVVQPPAAPNGNLRRPEGALSNLLSIFGFTRCRAGGAEMRLIGMFQTCKRGKGNQ